MDSKNINRRAWPRDAFWPVARCIVVALALSFTGCEHRISLSQFVKLQERAQQSSTAESGEAMVTASELARQQLGPYTLGSGDVLEVTITTAGLEATMSLPIVVRVNSNGAVMLPLAGTTQVGDMTLEDAEAAILQAYVPEYYAQASVHVRVTEPATADILVVGAAATPGLVALPRNERNLLFAMARAGGASQLASGAVTLRRFSSPTAEITVDLHTPDGLKTALELEPLASGDIVLVHAAEPNTVFVGGLVMATGPQTYPPGSEITLLQAIAAAGGLRTDLFPHEGTLIRRVDGKDVHIKLNLDRLANGKDPNIVLAGGDILWVPHTVDTRIHEFLQNTVYLRVGAGVYYRGSYSTTSSDLHGDEKERTSDTVIIGP